MEENGAWPGDANDLPHGTLDLLVREAAAVGPIHGFGISKWIEQRTQLTPHRGF